MSPLLTAGLALLLTASLSSAGEPARVPARGTADGATRRLVEVTLVDGRTVMAYLPVPWEPQPPILRTGALDIDVAGRTHRLSPGAGDEAECHAVRDGGPLRGECTAIVDGARVTTVVLGEHGCESVAHGGSCLIVTPAGDRDEAEPGPAR